MYIGATAINKKCNGLQHSTVSNRSVQQSGILCKCLQLHTIVLNAIWKPHRCKMAGIENNSSINMGNTSHNSVFRLTVRTLTTRRCHAPPSNHPTFTACGRARVWGAMSCPGVGFSEDMRGAWLILSPSDRGRQVSVTLGQQGSAIKFTFKQ